MIHPTPLPNKNLNPMKAGSGSVVDQTTIGDGATQMGIFITVGIGILRVQMAGEIPVGSIGVVRILRMSGIMGAGVIAVVLIVVVFRGMEMMEVRRMREIMGTGIVVVVARRVMEMVGDGVNRRSGGNSEEYDLVGL